MKKLHNNHKLHLFKPVTLVGASYCVCVCVCVCARARLSVYLVDQGRKQH